MEEHEEELASHDPLVELGQELKREREVREISLQEIADRTKVSSRFLQAIEEGDHRSLPAPVFTRGFIHEYALFLGLDPDAMSDRYAAHVRADEERLLREGEGPEPIPMLPAAVWIKIGIAVGILLLIGAIAFFFFMPAEDDAPTDPVAVEGEATSGQTDPPAESSEEVDSGESNRDDG